MTSDRGVVGAAFGLLAAFVSLAAAVTVARAELRIGGAVGFGFEAQRVPGAFRWDLDSARADSMLAVLHLGAEVGALTGFVAIATGEQRERTERLALREAAVTAARRRGDDSTCVRAFLDQPGSLWLDHPIAPPWRAVSEGRAAGGRADAEWRALGATVIAVDRRGNDDEPLGSAWLGRLRADAPAGLRAGVTWTHQVPAVADLPFEPRRRDVVGFDVRGAWRQSTVAIEYAEAHAAFASGADEAAREPGLRRAFRFDRSRRLTDILPSRAALRAELRLRAVPLGRWGRLGAAPSYRALGAHFTDPLAAAERDFGAPRRGLEGPRLETWFEPAGWPGWLRWVYDRHITFRDTDRRTIAQELEAQGWVFPGMRVRAAYIQRDVRVHGDGRRERHQDVLGEVVAEERGARLRLQAARVDLDTETARTVGALEVGTRVVGRLQGGMRLTVAVQAGVVRRGAFLVARFFHLPQFEVAAQYGSDALGDGTEPALDADLTGAGALEDRFRLLVRGWF